MKDLIVQAVTSALFGGSVSAFLVWVAKTYIGEKMKSSIKMQYDCDLEVYKSQLKATSDTEIEKLRSQLSTVATQTNIMFSKLHEKRAIVITETYKLLVELYAALSRYCAIFEPAGCDSRDARRKQAADSFVAFRDYVAVNAIFLPKPTADKVNDLRDQLFFCYNKFFYSVDIATEVSKKTATWMEVYDSLEKPIKRALSDLETDFRTLLGDAGHLKEAEPAAGKSAA